MYALRNPLTSGAGRLNPGTVTVIFFVSVDEGRRMGLVLCLRPLGVCDVGDDSGA